jgi:hypothetical protein
MAQLALCVANTSCGRVGFDMTASIDGPNDAVPDMAIDANLLPLGGFSNPIALGVGGADPQVRFDGLELWLAVVTPPNFYDLYTSTRTSTNLPWNPPVAAPIPNSSGNDIEPALSADGLVLMFISERSGARRLHESTRTSVAGTFSVPAIPVGLEDLDIGGIDLDPSGNRLFFESNTQLMQLERPSRTSAFGAPTAIAAPAVQFPSLSPDALLLVYNSDGVGNAHWATRPNINQPFVDRGAILFPGCNGNGSDPDISADGLTLLIRCSEIKMLTRP